MWLIAVHDDAGIIVGAVIDDGKHPTPFPVPDNGYLLARIELDPEYERLPLDILCSQLRVDAEGNRLVRAEERRAP
jgi:hypothetical protein